MTELGDLQREEAFQSVWAGNSEAFEDWLLEANNWAKLGQCLASHLLPVPASPQDRRRDGLLAREIETGGRIVVRATLEPTTDAELARLLSETSNQHASGLVWIAPHIEKRHRQVIRWLNSLSGDWFRAFAVEVELWRIKDSPPAPRFTLVCRPSHWVPLAAGRHPDTDARRARQQDFWTRFAALLEERHYPYGEVPKPRPQNWMPFAIGRNGIYLSTVFSTPDLNDEHVEGELRVELVLRYGEAIPHFEALHARRAELSERLGEPLRWYRRDDMNMARIYVRQTIAHAEASDKWPEYQEWLYERLLRFREVFHEIICEL